MLGFLMFDACLSLTGMMLHRWWMRPVTIKTGQHWTARAIDSVHHRINPEFGGPSTPVDAGFAKVRTLGAVVLVLVLLLVAPVGLLSLVVLAYLVWRAGPSIREDVSNLFARTGRGRRRGAML